MACATFVVELFMAGCFDPSPSVVIHPVPFIAEEELPTPAKRSSNLTSLSPEFSPKAFWSNARVRISRIAAASPLQVLRLESAISQLRVCLGRPGFSAPGARGME